MKNTLFPLAIFLGLLLVYSANGQQNPNTDHLTAIKGKLESLNGLAKVSFSEETGFPYAITFQLNDKAQPAVSQAQDLIQDIYDLPKTATLIPHRQRTNIKNATIDRYQLYYRGIKVEHGQYTVLSKGDKIVNIQSEHYALDHLNLQPGLSEKGALYAALQHVGAKTYAWEQLENLIHTGIYNSKYIEAFKKAKDQLFPHGELVLVKNYTDGSHLLDLAYKFTIEAYDPLSKDDVYVNAHTGAIMLVDPHIKHGTGKTRYAGVRTFPTTNVGSNLYELKGTDPTSGIYLETQSLEGIGGLPLSVPLLYELASPIQDGDQTTDPCFLANPPIAETGDDVWGTATNGEHRPAQFNNICCLNYTPNLPLVFDCNEVENDDVALDAHWGAAVVAQYWDQIHNRNSYDDAGADIISFVHYGDAYDNAFWNGSFMTYGDGSYQGGTNPNGSFAPLSSLDVCAHEIGHAICTFTSDLVYQRESGAMNEGFSDIWAACVERFALDNVDGSLPLDPFGIGEQIDEGDGGTPPGQANSSALRWMDDPHAAGNPDTYGSNDANWTEPECGEPTLVNDYCGVHGNSGVLNKWFYLLATGSGKSLSPGSGKAATDDGVNENGQAYTVNGLGFGDAELIVFLGETMLNPNSTFAEMRTASITAAQTLFGVCSQQEESTTNAWYGVGVGPAFSPCGSQTSNGQTEVEALAENVNRVKNKDNNSLNFYPNPTLGWLHFNTVENIEYLTIYDALGKVVLSGSADVVFDENVLNLSGLTPGLLYLTIQMKDASVISKRIVLNAGN